MVKVGLAVAEVGKTANEEVRVIVTAEVGVDHRLFRMAAHAGHADDMSGAFGNVPAARALNCTGWSMRLRPT